MLALATIALLTMAGCGGDGSTPLVADETDDSSTTTADSEREEDGGTVPPPDGQADDPGAATPVIVDDEGYEPTLAMPDITDPKPHPIDDVVVSEDGDRLGVRYEGASEPCAGAFAEVAETVDTVTITLETGLNPNAAAMTCIAQVIRYELAVPLENPLGDRELVFDRDGQKAESSADGEGDGSDDQNSQAQTTVEASPSDDGGADGDRGAEEAAATTTTVRPPTTAGAGEGPADGLSPPGAFVGLALGDAQAKANGEGRPWRIGRLDDESYALTADYNPERVTFDVDGGVVTKAVAG